MYVSHVLCISVLTTMVAAMWPSKCCLIDADDREVVPIVDCERTSDTTWQCPNKGTIEYHYNAHDPSNSLIKVTPLTGQNFFVHAYCEAAEKSLGGTWSNLAFCPPSAATTSPQHRPFFPKFHGCATPWFKAVLYTGYQDCSP